MDELRELYQQVILDHNRNPKNFHELPEANRHSEGYNPLCGDRVKIYLDVEDDVIRDVAFQGAGCAISKASASVMTTLIKGKTVKEALALFHKFQQMITSDTREPVEMEELDKMAVFSGVREFPSRIKCAALAWHTMKAALQNQAKQVSTE